MHADISDKNIRKYITNVYEEIFSGQLFIDYPQKVNTLSP